MKHGFSLVELSIVLVILGLLTGGILTGQNLIRAAELRSVTTEYSGYQTAVNTFRDKYFQLPGDMNNATDFWGAADNSGAGGECGDILNDVGTGTQTCNGNGTGSLDLASYAESYRFWQHLANAGLIEGTYSGVRASASNPSITIGVNVPKSKLSSAGWHVQDMGVTDGSGSAWYAANYQIVFEFGGSIGGWTVDPIVLPEEAWNIDTKVDDGKPGAGMMSTFKQSASGVNPNYICASSDVPYTAEYILSSSSLGCHLIFKSGM